MKSQVYTFCKGPNIVGVDSILKDSGLLLTQLTHKEWYLPFLEKMSEHRKREWLSVRVLLKELLGEEKEILYQASGKPYLADNSYRISISHTQGYVAVILNKGKEVAIDIEKISPRVEKIRTRFVNEKEEEVLSKTNEQIHLLIYWSAKESMYKILGKKNVEFKLHLHIQPFEPCIGEWSSFTAYEMQTKEQNMFAINYYVHEDYVLTYI
jgi:phosphopantetheinyl transferase